jgi:hypothetical protein
MITIYRKSRIEKTIQHSKLKIQNSYKQSNLRRGQRFDQANSVERGQLCHKQCMQPAVKPTAQRALPSAV